jgi:hypothetical protein
VGAATFALLAAVFALVAWLVVRHSRGDHGADIALAAVIGGAIGAVFGPPLFDRWLRTGQAAEDEVKQEEAELLRDAESLVLSMHAYSDGYRELSGHLLGFSEHWTDKQRGKAIDTYGKWMDRREIAREIRIATMRLDERCSELASSGQAKRESPALLDLRDAANTFLAGCVGNLISWKAHIPSRQMFDSALRNARTMEDAKPVREWAETIFFVYQPRGLHPHQGRHGTRAASERPGSDKQHVMA